MQGKVVHTKEQWKQLLNSEQYHVLREKGTDPRIPTLLSLWRSPRDAKYAERAIESLTARDLALLLLLDGEQDRPLMDALLSESGLAPAEVFDLAELLE